YLRHLERYRQYEVRHARLALQHGIRHPSLEQVGHALGAGNLVCQHGRRTLVLRPGHLAHPNADALAQAARASLAPPITPIALARRAVKFRRAVETVEVGTNELAVLHADAVCVEEIGHPAGWIYLIIGTALLARLRRDDLDAILQFFLDHHDARQPRIR